MAKDKGREIMNTTQPELFEIHDVGLHREHAPAVQLTTPPDMAGQPPAQNVDTSLDAADRIKGLPKTKFSEAVLRQWLMERGGYGATDSEAQEHFSWDGDYERPRRWSLVKQGLVVKTALRRMTADGNPAVVWVVK